MLLPLPAGASRLMACGVNISRLPHVRGCFLQCRIPILWALPGESITPELAVHHRPALCNDVGTRGDASLLVSTDSVQSLNGRRLFFTAPFVTIHQRMYTDLTFWANMHFWHAHICTYANAQHGTPMLFDMVLVPCAGG